MTLSHQVQEQSQKQKREVTDEALTEIAKTAVNQQAEAAEAKCGTKRRRTSWSFDSAPPAPSSLQSKRIQRWVTTREAVRTILAKAILAKAILGQGNPGQGNPGQGNPGQRDPDQANPGQAKPVQDNPGQGSPSN